MAAQEHTPVCRADRAANSFRAEGCLAARQALRQARLVGEELCANQPQTRAMSVWARASTRAHERRSDKARRLRAATKDSAVHRMRFVPHCRTANRTLGRPPSSWFPAGRRGSTTCPSRLGSGPRGTIGKRRCRWSLRTCQPGRAGCNAHTIQRSARELRKTPPFEGRRVRACSATRAKRWRTSLSGPGCPQRNHASSCGSGAARSAAATFPRGNQDLKKEIDKRASQRTTGLKGSRRASMAHALHASKQSGHSHPVWPDNGWYCPAAHGLHCASPAVSAKEPGGQAEQDTGPCVSFFCEERPAGQE